MSLGKNAMASRKAERELKVSVLTPGARSAIDIEWYAGIGARKTPEHVLGTMERLGSRLAHEGIGLRSGGAEGADEAFEKGCDQAKGRKEIVIPWKGFRGRTENCHWELYPSMFTVAESAHPAWDRLSDPVRRLMARNVCQVTGYGPWGISYSLFILCYTPGGKGQGGTGLTVRLAKAYGIPVFDLGFEEELKEWEGLLDGTEDHS